MYIFRPSLLYKKTRVIDSRRAQNSTPRYSDNWKSLELYLEWLRIRIVEAKRLLTKDGVIFIHCDWHASHYIKIIMDDVFGYKNFKNEIIWQRSTTIGRSSKNNFKKLDTISDSIFLYSKNINLCLKKVFRNHFIPFNGSNPPSGYYYDDKKGEYFKTSPLGNYSKDSIEMFYKQGRIYLTRNGKERLKYFVEVTKKNGTLYICEHRELGNIWNDIHSMMHSCSKNKISYPTQKPTLLLKRIFSMCTSAGDIVADFFNGSGTSLIAAKELNLYYLGSDINPEGIAITSKRLEANSKQAA